VPATPQALVLIGSKGDPLATIISEYAHASDGELKLIQSRGSNLLGASDAAVLFEKNS